ncbi:Bloc1s5 [Phodopus roborovskii]|uniref:Biogenesis of lysosome-related organelles complex 1 subunit 5 n=1 Tax=Phodopus roborovskii TaxID=109678 RepID=A0AAU9ZN70_PHORO|nr:Bloc1s5 [Phodopus roborovskii]
MSGGGTETPVACEAALGGGGKKRDSLGTPGVAHLIIKELRVLENLKNMIQETNDRMLPKCRETMQDGLEGALQRLQAANDSICRLQQREQERKKVINDHMTASEKCRLLQWEEFLKEQPQRRAEVDDEHRRAMERLKEQYAAMEKDLAKFATF